MPPGSAACFLLVGHNAPHTAPLRINQYTDLRITRVHSLARPFLLQVTLSRIYGVSSQRWQRLVVDDRSIQVSAAASALLPSCSCDNVDLDRAGATIAHGIPDQ